MLDKCVIGMTTGVYDLLHIGHKNLFKECATHCTFLLVAVASDWLTRVQKGPARPIEQEQVRCKKVQQFLVSDGIPGRAFITDLLDFNNFTFVDIYLLGAEQSNVRWNGHSIRIDRTPNVSTTNSILGKQI